MTSGLPDDVLVLVLRAAGPTPAMAVCRRWYALVHGARPPVVDVNALIVERGMRWVDRRVRACSDAAVVLVLAALLFATAQPALHAHGVPGFLLLAAVHALAHFPRRALSVAVVAAATALFWRTAGRRVAVALAASAATRFAATAALGFCGPTMRAAVLTETLVLATDDRVPPALVLFGLVAVCRVPDFPAERAPEAVRCVAAFLVRRTVTRRAMLHSIAFPPTLGRALQCNTDPCTPCPFPAGRSLSQEEWMAAWVAARALEHRVRSALRSA